MALPILMSSVKVKYCCHLPLLLVHYEEEGLKFCFRMHEHIKIKVNKDNHAMLKTVLIACESTNTKTKTKTKTKAFVCSCIF